LSPEGNPDQNADQFFAPVVNDTYRKYNNATYGYEDYYAYSPEWWKEADDLEMANWTPARIELCAMTFVDCQFSAYEVTMFDVISDSFYPGMVLFLWTSLCVRMHHGVFEDAFVDPA
jgi:hypothetical protein